MGPMWIILFLVLNFAISAWNAYAVGRAWVETRVAGGWPRMMAWMGAVMSACGFSWCYLFLLALGANYFWPTKFPDNAVQVALNLGYLVLIPGFLLSGFMIMLDSWRRAFRNGGFLNYGLAAYNTYAQIHNTMSAINSFGPALRNVTDFFKDSRRERSSDDARGALILIVIVIVLAALLGGVLTTTLIIRLAAGSDPLPNWHDASNRRNLPHS
jgi:hypothetical protein